MRRNALFITALTLCALASYAHAQDDLERIDAESASRSAERNLRAPHAALAAGCPYTTTTILFGPAQAGTGLDEEIVVMTPCGFNPAGPPLPLVVMFNGYCLGPKAIFNGITQIPDEANMRGWLVVAIRCGGQLLQKKSYGLYKCQPNVEFVLNYMTQNYPVDEDRIYGVGWSAGGGGIISYGARHLDPSRPMFAAIATNAGTFDMVNRYNAVGLEVKTWLMNPLMFGGAPAGPSLFGYIRSSVLLYDVMTSQIDLAASQIVNLEKTPILHVYSLDDPVYQLALLNIAFKSYLQGVGAPITSVPFTGLVDPHSWDLLDPVTTLDFLQQQTLDREPSSFSALADRDATYYWAEIEQRTTGSFAKIECSTDSINNRLDVTATSNVDRVTLSPPAVHFDANVDFQLQLVNSDVLGAEVVLTGVSQSPTYVLDGTTLSHAWTYSPPAAELTFTLPAGTTQLLTVRYDDYSATLTGTPAPPIGTPATLLLSGATPGQPFVLFLGLAQGVVPLSLFDPAESRNLLIGASPAPILLQGALNGAAQASVSFFVPNNPALIGVELFNQFVTLPGSTTLVDQISNRFDVLLSP